MYMNWIVALIILKNWEKQNPNLIVNRVLWIDNVCLQYSTKLNTSCLNTSVRKTKVVLLTATIHIQLLKEGLIVPYVILFTGVVKWKSIYNSWKKQSVLPCHITVKENDQNNFSFSCRLVFVHFWNIGNRSLIFSVETNIISL